MGAFFVPKIYPETPLFLGFLKKIKKNVYKTKKTIWGVVHITVQIGFNTISIHSTNVSALYNRVKVYKTRWRRLGTHFLTNRSCCTILFF